MKQLLIILILSIVSFAQVKTTVTAGTIQDTTGTAATSGYVQFDIQPTSSGLNYSVPGVGAISTTGQCSINGSGQLSSCDVWGTGVIVPANTTYCATYFPNGVETQRVCQLNITGASFDLTRPVFAPIATIIPQYNTITTSPINANIVPAANSVFTLGNAAAHFSQLWVDTIFGVSTLALSNLTVGNLNSLRFADQFSGSDIGAKANAAFLSCTNACTVIIPAGSYSYSTTINFPVIHDGTAKLIGTGGVTLTYTGSGYAVDALGQASSVNAANVDIEGLQIIGSSSGLAGIRLALFNRGVLINNDIQGFANGPGILNQGANAVTYIGNNVRANKYGLHDIGSGTESASGNTWIGGHIQSNTSYGYWCDSSVTTAGLNAGNSFHGATVEGNDVNYFIEGGRAISIFGGYMEGVTSKNVVLGGTTADAAHTAYATVISGTFMATPNLGDSFFLQQAIGTKIDGNFEIGTPTNFVNQAAASQQTDVGRNTAALVTNYWAGTDDTQTAIVYPSNKQWIPDVFAGNSLAAKLAKTATVRGTAELNASDHVPDALNANLSHGVNVTDAGNLGMSFGVTSTGTTHGWIQARNNLGASNTAYPLWLNELGGEVKVGSGGLKIGASGSNIPDSRELLQSVHNCGTTATCSNTSNGSYREVFGSVPLTSATPSIATITGISPAFTSTSTYECTCSPNGATVAIAAGGCAVSKVSASSFTLTGPATVTTVVSFSCKGN